MVSWVLQRTPLGGALLEVVDDAGTVFRSHMSGAVDVIVPWRDPYPPGCEYLTLGLDDCGI